MPVSPIKPLALAYTQEDTGASPQGAVRNAGGLALAKLVQGTDEMTFSDRALELSNRSKVSELPSPKGEQPGYQAARSLNLLA